MKGEEVTRLKVGDRVRVTTRARKAKYNPGDKGTVTRGAKPFADYNIVNYIVSMDKDGPTDTGVVFAADEIEPDS
jgi:hypothetical protein